MSENEPHVIITIEAAFVCRELKDWQPTLSEALDTLRGMGAARIIGSKTVSSDPFLDPEWKNEAVSYITITAPVQVEVD